MNLCSLVDTIRNYVRSKDSCLLCYYWQEFIRVDVPLNASQLLHEPSRIDAWASVIEDYVDYCHNPCVEISFEFWILWMCNMSCCCWSLLIQLWIMFYHPLTVSFKPSDTSGWCNRKSVPCTWCTRLNPIYTRTQSRILRRVDYEKSLNSCRC